MRRSLFTGGGKQRFSDKYVDKRKVTMYYKKTMKRNNQKVINNMSKWIKHVKGNKCPVPIEWIESVMDTSGSVFRKGDISTGIDFWTRDDEYANVAFKIKKQYKLEYKEMINNDWYENGQIPAIGSYCEYVNDGGFKFSGSVNEWITGDKLHVVAVKSSEVGLPVAIVWNERHKTATSLIIKFLRPISKHKPKLKEVREHKESKLPCVFNKNNKWVRLDGGTMKEFDIESLSDEYFESPEAYYADKFISGVGDDRKNMSFPDMQEVLDQLTKFIK